MDKFKKLFILFFILIQINVSNVHAQLDLVSKNHYVWFDNVVGSGNLGIYNGTIFVETFKTQLNNHRFLLDDNYHLGNLVYDNQPYFNIYLKYDIHEDELIAKLTDKKNFIFIKLIKEKISFFEIINSEKLIVSEKYSFINISNKLNVIKKPSNSFYQILFESDRVTLLKKNFKKRGNKIVGNFVYSKFSNQNYFVILKDGDYSLINSRNDIVKLFPNQKKNVKFFYRKNRKLHRRNKEVFYIKLLENLNIPLKH